MLPLGVTISQAQANLYAWLPYSSSTAVLNGLQIAPLFQDSSNARWTKEPLSEWVRPSELITRVTFKSLSPLQISGEILLESIFYTQPDGGLRTKKKKKRKWTNKWESEQVNECMSEWKNSPDLCEKCSHKRNPPEPMEMGRILKHL